MEKSEKNIHEKNKRRIPASDVPTADPRLGTYVDGYRSLPGSPKRWTVWGLAISTALTLLIALIMIAGNTSSTMIILCTFGGGFMLTFAMMMVLFSDNVGTAANPLNYYYVFSNGFMAEDRLKDGSIVSQSTVCFDDVRSMDTYLDWKYGYQHAAKISNLNFKVFGLNGNVIFMIRDVNIQYVSSFAATAILDSWVAKRSKKVMENFYKNGYAIFENIKMTRDAFIIDGKNHLENANSFSISDAYLTFTPADAEKSKYYDKLTNPSGSWRISINNLKNKNLFIKVFQEIYKDRLH